MEPELFALARRMSLAFEYEAYKAGENPLTLSTLTYKRAWLRAAIVTRPDLAEGLRVPKGHWAAGVLEVSDE